MGAAIGDVLGLAVGVAVSPVPIVVMILILTTPLGRANGTVFAMGWLAGLAILGAVILLVANPADASSAGKPAAWVGWLKLLLGVIILAGAVRHWRAQPVDGAEPQMPKWMAGLDRLRPAKALGLGALLAAVNPKNAALTISAAASVAAAGLPGGQQAITLAVFVLLGSAGILAPLAVYLTTGERAIKTLDAWKTWSSDHNEAIMAVLSLVFGVKLIGDGIGVLF
jgi:threonine/homoserine/homoserine lactone efflux protein